MEWYIYVGVVILGIIAYTFVVDLRTKRGLKNKKAEEREEYKNTHKTKKKKK